ncbi:MAG: tRNA-binding protein [Bacteroidota bacterium]
MTFITWSEFEKVDIRVGTILKVEAFPEASNPAYIITVDLGELGKKKSSAQLTRLYMKEDLIGRKVICIVNFRPKQIGPIMSEVLITGFDNGNNEVVLAVPDVSFDVPNGARLF